MKRWILVLFIICIIFECRGYPVHSKTQDSIREKATQNQVINSKENTEDYILVDAIDLVKNPDQYLAKKIKLAAEFSSFSMLGLNYKPALRDSKEYIGMIIKRPNTTPGIEIPLSELKIFIRRKIAESFSDLENGDKIEIQGKVFSKAMGDPWMEADTLKIISSPKKTTKHK